MRVPDIVALSLGTMINRQAAGNGRGAITGDFVPTTADVVPVQHAPVENRIRVTAIHNHMPGKEPRPAYGTRPHSWPRRAG
jgi:hypothetical protein